jgi:hypothetical protein
VAGYQVGRLIVIVLGQLARYEAAAVGHRDRFARFGGGTLRQGCRRTLLVADPAGAGGDLARDLNGILAWLCVGRYGRVGARGRSERAVAALGQDGPA